MNKIITGVIILAAIAIGWFILNPGDTFDYVVTVDSEITDLENELAALDAQVTAGTLTEEQATAAKVSIVTRLNAINTAASNSERAQLTPAQRVQLSEGLDRLKNILITYQATLNVVEDKAVETTVQAELNRKGGSYKKSQHLSLIVANVIEEVEVTVVDSVQDYEADAELDAQIDIVVEETEEEVEAEVDDAETATSTGETMEESDVEPADETEEESTTAEDSADGAAISVEAETDVELDTTN